MNCKNYITETKIFTQNGSTDSNCNSILFVNTGSVNVTIENLVLQPSQSWSIEGNRDEMCVKVFYFNFDTGANPGLTAIFKRYV